MNTPRLTRYLLSLALAAVFAAGFVAIAPSVSLAQTDGTDLSTGLETVGETTGLGSEDPRLIVARVIRVALGFLGVLAVLIVLYGGFVWMTSSGDESKVSRAKGILISGVIGLVIIMLSFTIASFIISALVNSTGAGGGGGGGGSGSGGGISLGGGSGAAFSVTAFQPTGATPVRNVKLRVTFSKTLARTTEAGYLTVKKASDGSSVAGTVEISGNQMTFTPSAACSEPNTDRFCFDANTQYSVQVSPAVASSTGLRLVCNSTSCSSSFTTGEIVDTESPNLEVIVPENRSGVPAESLVPVQVSAQDDAQVSVVEFSAGDVLFDSVPATGENLRDVRVNTDWDTVGLTVGERYSLGAEVFDVAGNSADEGVALLIRPATCFNAIQDTNLGETGLDCGGDSANPNYCGSCDGGSCAENSDCGGSGVCTNGICEVLPTMQRVSPGSGGVGTFVTLSGRGFGSTVGEVRFTGPNGTVLASAPACAQPWSEYEVTVQVPSTAIDGPITLITTAGNKETTNDENGARLPDFDVTDESHPGLCSLAPTVGAPGDSLTLEGDRFGESRGESVVRFGENEESGSYASWTETKITATVPRVNDGRYSVYIVENGMESNALTYRVFTKINETPIITAIRPNEGAVGRYVSLDGSGFGDSTGTVRLKSKTTGDEAVAILDFPEECAVEDAWQPNFIRLVIPEKFANGNKLAEGLYDVSVVTQGGAVSNTVPFTVGANDIGPKFCGIDPNSGDIGDRVSIIGDRFGSNPGSVTFHPSVSAAITSWTDTKVELTVPSGAQSGKVSLSDAGGHAANDVYFLVEDEAAGGADAAKAASYAWSFSTGEIPEIPEVVFTCSSERISGVPNARFADKVCVNAVIYAEFTEEMNRATVQNGVRVERCTGSGTNPCSEVESVAGDISTTKKSFTFTPSSDLTVSSTYRVTVAAQVQSVKGVPLAQDISWSFATKDDTAECALDEVIVSPSEEVITLINDTRGFSALPVASDECVVLDASDYSWSWTVGQSFARFTSSADEECVGGGTSCATVEALAEGETKVFATETMNNVKDDADLLINFTDPYVTNTWPDCQSACTNAAVGASFNTAMKVNSVERSGRVSLFRCTNELCASLTRVAGAAASCTLNEEGDCTGFMFSDQTLAPSAFYRVIVSGDVESTSGVKLIRPNYGSDYSWTFRVSDDGAACAVNRVSLTPEEALVDTIGDRMVYSATAYGAADACSASGQRLNGFDYSWNWADPIKDADIDANPNTRVARWYNGTFVDSSPTKIAEGCTASCTATGSYDIGAICGDGTIDAAEGEECEDGNVSSGDGCSSSCLREGSVGRAKCGNGSIEENLTNGTGEECDDGNTTDGDGCSSACLVEGSRSVGATCGNRDIATLSPSGAGEECDDGNATNGDGCSSLCLNEGSLTLTEIGGAVCGNDRLEAPFENCDDGDLENGDGCSSQCLLEGSSQRYGSKCNDGDLGVGEECEDGNMVDGDGCSSKCLLEGSSIQYATPSFCGDGVWDPKSELEMCEVGASGDARVDPDQLAEVKKDAVFEIDPAIQKATATIEVSEVSSGLGTDAALSLMCAATSDLDCQDPSTNGVGTNSCCMARPTARLYPAGGSTVCRNSALYGVFTDEMDLSTFAYTEKENGVEVQKYRMYARLNLSSVGGVCPTSHTTLAREPGSVFARAWNSVVRFLTGREANAASGDCVVPIVGYEQTAQANGKFKVTLKYGALLAENGKYNLVVEGDTNVHNRITEGVRSKYGVGMNTSSGVRFTAGSEVCALDALEVADTSETSPGLFTRGDEAHPFTAQAVSFAGNGSQEITSIPGSYAFAVSGWTSVNQDVFEVAPSSQDNANAIVTAQSQNGMSVIIATAKVTEDVLGQTLGKTVAGSANVRAVLCENPWPALGAFPWADDARSGDNGLAEEGIDWMNFATHYCRDAGDEGVEDDLPVASVVRPPLSRSGSIIKEYLFEMGDGSGDAIGIRVASNPDYLSPEAWYHAQGFSGNPSETAVDGFPAVRDGRTTYVHVPNMTDAGLLYSNIVIISYNQDATPDTLEVYDQLLDNLSFGNNIEDVTLCAEADGSLTNTICSSNFDCSTGQTCASDKARIRRDTVRLGDLTDLRSSVQRYALENAGAVPTLQAGTFVRAFAASTWDSWDDMLGGALGDSDLPKDPLNKYTQCGQTGLYESFDAVTCADQSRGIYVCPVDSYAYHYKAIGENRAEVSVDLEYPGFWATSIDDGVGTVKATAGGTASPQGGFETVPFCFSAIYGNSTTCGDGVVGNGEVCELGERGGSAVACDINGDSTNDGVRNQVCNSTCSAFVDDPAGACIAYQCGNGVIDPGERCDDGSFNGKYGYCGATCRYNSSFYCGDGELAGGEVCDCGDSDAHQDGDSRAYGSGVGACAGVNGDYAASSGASCAWNCAGPAAFCGDGVVDAGEQCDGEDDTWAGKLCYRGSAEMRGQPCTDDAMCGTGGVCGGGGARNQACPVGKTRVRTCDDADGATCTYTADWRALNCINIGSCGDGVVDPDEQCDDGNTDSTDSCTATCKVNVCGDGNLYVGEEECDLGTQNGQSCSSTYGSTCTACSLDCRNLVSSGAFCGDGVRNGAEYCDASDLPYTYITVPGIGDVTVGEQCETLGATRLAATCADVGVCNGGPRNGEYCTKSNDQKSADRDTIGCAGYACVKPTCADSCTSTCPFAYDSENVLLTANQPGSRPSESVSLYSFDGSSTAVLPNAATVTVPACRVGASFTATVDLGQVELPEVYTVFVVDRSASMGAALGNSTRMKVARNVLSDAVSSIYDALPGRAHIGLVGYSGYAGVGLCSTTGARSCASDAQCPSQSFCDEEGTFNGFLDESSEAAVLNRIRSFVEGGATETDDALREAKRLLDTIQDDNVRKVIVLLSDGDPGSRTDTSAAAAAAIAAGDEIYTVALTTSQGLILDMHSWSSNTSDTLYSINSENGIDYAYEGTTAGQLQSVYESIVNSITGITVSFISKVGNDVKVSSLPLTEGVNQPLPWPEGFVCDGVNEKQLPIQVTFSGEGQIELSDVKLQYCSP